ncbi:MAG: alpha/beta hydrolase [Pseudobdellovibrio sp.]
MLISKFITSIAFLTVLITGLTGCNSGGGSIPGVTAPINPPVVRATTRENYMSGKQFCTEYKSITSQEYGRFISVPADYNFPALEQLQIYAYTVKPFDSNKPSYIFVDGGPGQNTHGMMPEYFAGQFNELRFDQRGLGCSAPESYDTYKNSKLYSSINNIKDMEEIRKAYGISQWSVYGLSYGTVPATMYGSKFPSATKSVVLEGVFGRPDQVHLLKYKAEKMNLALDGLNSKQRESFSNLINEDTEDSAIIIQLFYNFFYSDTGMHTMQDYLKIIITEDGVIHHEILNKFKERSSERDNKYKNPQQPGAVDENILSIIYCKNLDYRHKEALRLNYSSVNGFFTSPSGTKNYDKECTDAQVSIKDEEPYKLEDYPVSAPVYYFQGSHDGATMAIGALNHWKTVPKGASYFLLAQKGGHNPNLNRLEKNIPSIVNEETKIFAKSISGLEITQIDLNAVNLSLPNQKWLLFRDSTQSSSSEIVDELKGISLVGTNYSSLIFK